MADYIEKECSCEGIWDINKGDYTSGTCTIPDTPSLDNSSRWAWLLDKWKCMSDTEKIKLFMPIVHIIRLDNIERENEDEYVADEIAKFTEKSCRLVNKIKYQLNRNDIPIYTVIYDPINIDIIPDDIIKSELRSFGLRFGLIDNKGQYEKY